MKLSTAAQVARAGARRFRIRALRSSVGARRAALTLAGLRTGVLDALADGDRTEAELVEQLGVRNAGLFAGWMRVLAADGLVRGTPTAWRLSRLGRDLVADDTARAMVEAFGGYHTDLYRTLPEQLHDGSPRTDIDDAAELIARVSRLLEPPALDELTKVLSEHQPGRILDLGCGSGSLLVHALSASAAQGIGIDASSEAITQAARACSAAGVSSRVELVTGDATALLTGVEGPRLVAPATLDVAIAANMVYYLSTDALRQLLTAVAGALRPGGVLFVVTTDLDDTLMSRHFDLLLRAQRTPMGLFPRQQLLDLLAESGFTVRRVKRLVPKEPLVAIQAVKTTALTA